MIYLDNAATTMADPKYCSNMDAMLHKYYANPGSPHKAGRDAKRIVEEARQIIANFVHCSNDGVIFTSSGSEANNLAILGLEKHLKSIGKTHIVSTKYEHPSVLNSLKEMENRGFSVTYLSVPDGRVNIEDFTKNCTQNTGFVSIMHTNNELGTTNPVAHIYDICKERGIIFHSDCVQAMGSFVVDMENIADIITFSGHKFHAPKGIGCLCKKDNIPLSPVVFGGSQEFGLRAGTENTAFIRILGLITSDLSENIHLYNEKILEVCKVFIKEFSEQCKTNHIDAKFNTGLGECRKVLSICINDVDAQSLIMMLSSMGVYVSAGSACSDHSTTPSHVLKAAGLSDEEAMCTIRVSFSRFTTVSEVIVAAQRIAECAAYLKTIAK